jgi:hypothetical protein
MNWVARIFRRTLGFLLLSQCHGNLFMLGSILTCLQLHISVDLLVSHRDGELRASQMEEALVRLSAVRCKTFR